MKTTEFALLAQPFGAPQKRRVVAVGSSASELNRLALADMPLDFRGACVTRPASALGHKHDRNLDICRRNPGQICGFLAKGI